MSFKRTDIKPFEKKVWLSSPTMHGDEIKYVKEAYDTNWMSTVGENINEVEKQIAEDTRGREHQAFRYGVQHNGDKL